MVAGAQQGVGADKGGGGGGGGGGRAGGGSRAGRAAASASAGGGKAPYDPRKLVRDNDGMAAGELDKCVGGHAGECARLGALGSWRGHPPQVRAARLGGERGDCRAEAAAGRGGGGGGRRGGRRGGGSAWARERRAAVGAALGVREPARGRCLGIRLGSIVA